MSSDSAYDVDAVQPYVRIATTMVPYTAKRIEVDSPRWLESCLRQSWALVHDWKTFAMNMELFPYQGFGIGSSTLNWNVVATTGKGQFLADSHVVSLADLRTLSIRFCLSRHRHGRLAVFCVSLR